MWRSVAGRQPRPKSAPFFLPRGLIIQGNKVHIDNGTLIAQNGRRFDLTDVNTSGVARHRTLRFYEASFTQDCDPCLRQSDDARGRSDGPRCRRAHRHAVREPADRG